MDDRKTVAPIDQTYDRCRVVAMSDVGCVREENQDFMGHAVSGDQTLVIVCDGMGGHSGGYEASRLAVREICTFFEENAATKEPSDLLAEAIHRANTKVYETSESNPHLKGMGTTAVAMILKGDSGWLAHVGDSRAYLLRAGEVSLLTLDHTAINRFVLRGHLHPDETRNHRLGHILERSVGVDRQVKVDVQKEPVTLQKGDRVILCSDGFWGLASDDDIKRLFTEKDLRASVEESISHALFNDADDNATIGVLQMLEGSEDNGLPPDVRTVLREAYERNRPKDEDSEDDGIFFEDDGDGEEESDYDSEDGNLFYPSEGDAFETEEEIEQQETEEAPPPAPSVPHPQSHIPPRPTPVVVGGDSRVVAVVSAGVIIAFGVIIWLAMNA